MAGKMHSGIEPQLPCHLTERAQHSVIATVQNQMCLGEKMSDAPECPKQQVRALDQVEPSNEQDEWCVAETESASEIPRVASLEVAGVDPIRYQRNAVGTNPILQKMLALVGSDRDTGARAVHDTAADQPVVERFQQPGATENRQRAGRTEYVGLRLLFAFEIDRGIDERPVSHEVYHVRPTHRLWDAWIADGEKIETSREAFQPDHLDTGQRMHRVPVKADVQGEHPASHAGPGEKPAHLQRTLRGTAAGDGIERCIDVQDLHGPTAGTLRVRYQEMKSNKPRSNATGLARPRPTILAQS